MGKPLDTLSSPYKNLKLIYKNKEIGLIKNKETIEIYNHNTVILNNLILAYRRFQKYLYMDENIEITMERDRTFLQDMTIGNSFNNNNLVSFFYTFIHTIEKHTKIFCFFYF